MKHIKKNPPQKSGSIRKSTAKDPAILFSFEFFDHDDDEVCPSRFVEEYTQALTRRLRVLCQWTVHHFQNKYEKNIKNHIIEWRKTSRSMGFSRIPTEHKDAIAWQFAVAEHTHGRVHGFFIGNTFYIVWLDCNHLLYPGNPR